MNSRPLLKPALVLVVALLGAAAADAPRSVWDGVYSPAQAARGQKAYVAECVRCHGDKLQGNVEEESPPLVTDEFLVGWNGKSVGRLVDLTRRTMPPETAGTMSRPVTLDLVAFMLSANGFPAGKNDLPSDAATLREIVIELKKPAATQ